MEFVLYFLLRRYFVRQSVAGDVLYLRKGLFVRRHYRIPASAVIRMDIRRTLILRLLRGKKITLYTPSGKVSFYLHRDEMLDLLPQRKRYPVIKPHFSSVLAAAFSRTKALGGTAIFSVTLIRAGSIFGSEYYDTLSAFIKDTANGLDELLETLHIAVPGITTILAVFVAAAWVFVFVRNILRFTCFRIFPSQGILRIAHGVITIYETMLVHNDYTAVLQRDTAVTLLTDAAPVFYTGVMVLPPVHMNKRRKFMRVLRTQVDCRYEVRPPRKALFGHLAVPLGWGSASAAMLLFSYLTGSDPVLRTLLWVVLWISAWFCFLFGVYMRRSGCRVTSDAVCISARHGTELLTAYVPEKALAYLRLDCNPIQRRTGMCDMRVYFRSRTKLRLRNINKDDISEPL